MGHLSDCALHNELAERAMHCDCGEALKAQHRYAAWLCRLVCNQVVRWKIGALSNVRNTLRLR